MEDLNKLVQESVRKYGKAVVAGTYYHFKIIKYNSTRCDFWINGVFAGSSTTNLPGSGGLTGFILSIWKSAGTTSRLLHADYIKLIQFNYTN